jgi:hypothetical protein
MSKKLLLVLFLVVLSPLLLVVAAFAIPLVLLVKLKDYLFLRWHCWRTNCWTYLVCSPRRRWHEFVANNLVPSLPNGVGVAWTSGPQRAPKPLRRMFAAGAGKGKPYFAHVNRFTIDIYPLHSVLHPMLPHGHRDESVQKQLRTLLARELNTFLSVQ